MRKKETQISTIIGMGAVCNGDFTSDGSVRIDGPVIGNVTVTDSVIVGASGCIHGDINSRMVVIGGEVYGNLNVPEKVELTSTARVIGDLTTSALVIDEKAVFQGRCDMNQDVSKKVKLNNKAVKAMKKSAKSAIVEALKEVEAGAEEGSQGNAGSTESLSAENETRTAE